MRWKFTMVCCSLTTTSKRICRKLWRNSITSWLLNLARRINAVLNSRSQEPNETIDAYIAVLRSLTKTWGFRECSSESPQSSCCIRYTQSKHTEAIATREKVKVEYILKNALTYRHAEAQKLQHRSLRGHLEQVLRLKEIQQATAEGMTLQALKDVISYGWPKELIDLPTLLLWEVS